MVIAVAVGGILATALVIVVFCSLRIINDVSVVFDVADELFNFEDDIAAMFSEAVSAVIMLALVLEELGFIEIDVVDVLVLAKNALVTVANDSKVPMDEIPVVLLS